MSAQTTMANRDANWLTAAACTMPPARATSFGDLPPQHRKDIVRLGFLSAIAFAYTLAMGILAQPIPSRSLLASLVPPHGATPRSALMEASLVAPPLKTNRRPASIGLRPVVVTDNEVPVAQPRTPRRGNAFSRFFKGVWRTVS